MMKHGNALHVGRNLLWNLILEAGLAITIHFAIHAQILFFTIMHLYFITL